MSLVATTWTHLGRCLPPTSNQQLIIMDSAVPTNMKLINNAYKSLHYHIVNYSQILPTVIWYYVAPFDWYVISGKPPGAMSAWRAILFEFNMTFFPIISYKVELKFPLHSYPCEEIVTCLNDTYFLGHSGQAWHFRLLMTTPCVDMFGWQSGLAIWASLSRQGPNFDPKCSDYIRRGSKSDQTTIWVFHL